MREIKFRGKSTPTIWVYGGYTCIIDRYTKAVNYYITDPYGVDTYIDPATVGQYTGLKDAKGNEIYEGDILRLVGLDGGLDSDYTYTVEWRMGAFWLGDGEELLGDHSLARWAIVGNIHDKEIADD